MNNTQSKDANAIDTILLGLTNKYPMLSASVQTASGTPVLRLACESRMSGTIALLRVSKDLVDGHKDNGDSWDTWLDGVLNISNLCEVDYLDVGQLMWITETFTQLTLEVQA